MKITNLDTTYLIFIHVGKLWSSKLQEPGALIGNTDEFTNTLAAGRAPNTILFGVFQSISGYGGHYPCRLEAVRREYRKIDNGMVYQKNWPFTRLFNHHLLILKERGILVQIQNVHMDYFKVNICFKKYISFRFFGY